MNIVDFFKNYEYVELKSAGILKGKTNELNSDSVNNLINFMRAKNIEELFQLNNRDNKIWFLKCTGEFYNSNYKGIRGNIFDLYNQGVVDRMGRIFHNKNVEFNIYYNNPHNNIFNNYTKENFVDKDYLKSKSKFNKLSQSNLISYIQQEESNYDPTRIYDIFISHSFVDASDIIYLKDVLEQMGYSTYVDWIQDKKLDRSRVSGITANLLRERMRSCRSLLYVISQNSRNSLWMPWELGFFDASKGTASVIPIREKDNHKKFKGQEYIELYPYATISQDELVISENEITYNYRNWLEIKSGVKI